MCIFEYRTSGSLAKSMGIMLRFVSLVRPMERRVNAIGLDKWPTSYQKGKTLCKSLRPWTERHERKLPHARSIACGEISVTRKGVPCILLILSSMEVLSYLHCFS